MKRGILSVVVGAACLALTAQAGADEAERAANAIKQAMEETAGGSVLCNVQSATQAIICIANADEENADRLAVGTVLVARTQNLPLAGWSITIVTLTDYVVTQRF